MPDDKEPSRQWWRRRFFVGAFKGLSVGWGTRRERRHQARMDAKRIWRRYRTEGKII